MAISDTQRPHRQWSHTSSERLTSLHGHLAPLHSLDTMPRSTSAASRGTKRHRTSAPDIKEPAADASSSSALPIPHVDPTVNSLLQNSALDDPPSPPATSFSSHYFDAHIGSGKQGSRRRNQRSLLAVRQEAVQSGFDPSIPLLCKDATERSERLLTEHRQLFPKWHMQLKSATSRTHQLSASHTSPVIRASIDQSGCSALSMLLLFPGTA